MTTTIERKRFIKKYTLNDIKQFLDDEGFEWRDMQVKNIKAGTWSNGNIGMFNGKPVYAYLILKDKNQPFFADLMVTNEKFIVSNRICKIDLSDGWEAFYESNHKELERTR